MTKNRIKKSNELVNIIINNWREACYMFLGAGLMLYILNISSLLTNLNATYNSREFGISVFLSVIMIIFLVHTLTEKK
jgi:hypothetical protein